MTSFMTSGLHQVGEGVREDPLVLWEVMPWDQDTDPSSWGTSRAIVLAMTCQSACEGVFVF